MNFIKNSARCDHQFSPLAQTDHCPKSTQPAGKKKTVHKKPSATVLDSRNKNIPPSQIITPVIDRSIPSNNKDKPTDLDLPTAMVIENQVDTDTSRSSSASASSVIPDFQLPWR